MMLHILLGLLFADVVAANFRKPLELVLQLREDRCSLISLRLTQQHRGLLNAPFVQESRRHLVGPKPSSDEQHDMLYFYYYSENSSQVKHHVSSLCLNGVQEITWDLDVRDYAQQILGHPIEWRDSVRSGLNRKDVPPLLVRPLIVSGPSENRVDLVFFSDGCM